jgi:hypothetical protein
MPSRVIVGRDVDVIRELPDGVELMGRARLRPGFPIEIAHGVNGATAPRGAAVVWSWRIRCLGSGGPIFRGECRWCPALPAIRPPVAQETPETGARPKPPGWHVT